MKVYLAGAINGCTDEQAKGWREEIKRRLPNIEWLDPMDRDYRGQEDQNVEAIVLADIGDIVLADVVLVHAAFPSWGTAMETWEASGRGKTVIVWVEPGRPVSPWLRHVADYLFDNIYEVESRLGQLAVCR